MGSSFRSAMAIVCTSLLQRGHEFGLEIWDIFQAFLHALFWQNRISSPVHTPTLSGKNVRSIIQPWLGTIQWIGQSPFRKNHKRKNWFIGFFEIKKQKLIEFNEKKVRYQSMRSSGAGGQHVNKVSSAVRATHVPTGIQAVSMDSRSQLQNKKTALLRLKEKLAEINQGKSYETIIDKWSNHLELERGNPVKVFVGERFKLKR